MVSLEHSLYLLKWLILNLHQAPPSPHLVDEGVRIVFRKSCIPEAFMDFAPFPNIISAGNATGWRRVLPPLLEEMVHCTTCEACVVKRLPSAAYSSANVPLTTLESLSHSEFWNFPFTLGTSTSTSSPPSRASLTSR